MKQNMPFFINLFNKYIHHINGIFVQMYNILQISPSKGIIKATVSVVYLRNARLKRSREFETRRSDINATRETVFPRPIT